MAGYKTHQLEHDHEKNDRNGMVHDDPNAKRVAKSASGVLVWHFTDAGAFEFACLIPGHREAGMTGRIVVE